ncbi:MAG: phosphatase PAP2 family protein [Dehalococcoidia bacterium]|nr:phosphatase PAP2 family protein [Dehalococcoidia bacterium]
MASPRTRQLMRAAAVLGIAAMVLTLVVAAEGAPLPGDVRVARAVQDTGLRENAGIINALGDWRAVPFAASALLIVLRLRLGGGRPPGRVRADALAAYVMVLPLWLWGVILKVLVASPRPTEDFGLFIDRARTTYGFPSGHVYGDVLVYGAMAAAAAAYLHARLVLPARAAAVAIIVLAGPARIVVGAHWPSDVLGAYLWGGCALCLALAAASASSRFPVPRSR